MGAARVLLALEAGDRPAELAQSLRDVGIEPDVAAAGDAIVHLAAAPCDVLVGPASALGGGLHREARALSPDLEVVAVVSAEDAVRGPACLRAGAGDLLLSPVEPTALLDAVSRALERRRARGLARECLRVARRAALGQLAAGIAHDLMNPASVLLSSCTALGQEMEKLGELDALLAHGAHPARGWWQSGGRAALHEALAISADAATAAQRLDRLARDVRNVARLEPERVVRVEVVLAVEMALRLAHATLTAYATVETQVPRNIHAQANTGALAMALAQLFWRSSQALASTGRRGTVWIGASAGAERVLLEVEDDAPPAAPRDGARHLLPYLPPGAPADIGALGLVVARELVEAQGGAISARSGARGGTVFEIALRD